MVFICLVFFLLLVFVVFGGWFVVVMLEGVGVFGVSSSSCFSLVLICQIRGGCVGGY